MRKPLAQPNSARMRILIVDDDISVLRIMAAMLRHWGYEMTLAHDGLEAWEILRREEDIRLVISDWMMPGLNGPELCQRVREAGFAGYTYLILLTGREDKLSLVEGMDAGADDFMIKPVHREELRVRVRAGERILRLEAELSERNDCLKEINHTLSKAYATIRHDLESAATMQQALLPAPLRLPEVTVEWLFQPSSFVAGDIFDYFMIDARRLSFYQLDVVGHGVPAALLSFTLHQVLAEGAEEKRLEGLGAEIAPTQVVSGLNRRFQSGIDPLLYFTLIYGSLDLTTGRVTLTQAGHPAPILLRHADRQTELLGDGGFPVGMFPEVEYEAISVDLAPGDRLFLYSDGVTECANPAGEFFSETQLRRLLVATAHLPAALVMIHIDQALREWKGDDNHEDDVTLLVLERGRPL